MSWSSSVVNPPDGGGPVALTDEPAPAMSVRFVDPVVSADGAWLVSLASTSSVPIGAKNKKLAFEFLNFRLDPEVDTGVKL